MFSNVLDEVDWIESLRPIFFIHSELNFSGANICQYFYASKVLI